MCIDFDGLVILAGTYLMLYLAFTTPSARDRERTTARRL